ncbi:MAG TPA: ergothioneine biosynthesis protein EgtC [Acidimicrobiales bacterium]|nr:ergothioneine biosynthesis protein EgtC [Acidimicrobiales bacterium]
MCRFLAYLGAPRTLESLLVEPGHSLLRQCWEPHHQVSGVVNADGFGVGWHDRDRRPEPALYRSTLPLWADRSFLSMAGLVAAGSVLAAVRSATPPLPTEASATPPFADGPWLFAHNGAVAGFHDGAAARLRRALTERREAGILGPTDSEVVFAHVLDRLDAGAAPATALAGAVEAVAAATGGAGPSRLNLVLSDGERIAATACGDSLFVRAGGGAVVVASEPFDEEGGWERLPDATVIEASAAAGVGRTAL